MGFKEVQELRAKAQEMWALVAVAEQEAKDWETIRIKLKANAVAYEVEADKLIEKIQIEEASRTLSDEEFWGDLWAFKGLR